MAVRRCNFLRQFLNLINLKPARKATFVLTGNWAVKASKEAARYGNCINIASSEDTNFDRIPRMGYRHSDSESSYAYITSNNTLYGTRWHTS